MPLPRLRVTNKFYRLTGGGKWESQEQEVEVLTVHLERGRMRVRGRCIDRENGKEEKPYVWDLPADEFFGKYEIVEKQDEKQC